MGDMSDQGHPYVRSDSGYTYRLCVCFQLFARPLISWNCAAASLISLTVMPRIALSNDYKKSQLAHI